MLALSWTSTLKCGAFKTGEAKSPFQSVCPRDLLTFEPVFSSLDLSSWRSSTMQIGWGNL